MVMGQFVTTYRKDYLWPYVKTLGLRPEPERLYQPQYRDERLCACHCLDPVTPTSQQRTVLGPEAHDHEQWSRLGPMGPLLEPMVFPAKVSYSPEAKVARYNQPNVFLLKLQEKYPFIYECLRTAPPDDILARINKDRLSTTYEVDYCHKPCGLAPRRREASNCPEEDPYYRPYEIKNNFNCFVKNVKSTCNSDIMTTKIASWDPFSKDAPPSEDVINRWGQMMYRDVLHGHGGHYTLTAKQTGTISI